MSTAERTPPSAALRTLAGMGRRQLERVFAAGTEPDVADVVGWEWRGLNPPKLLRAVGAERFAKAFVVASRGPEGYNMLVSQRDWTRKTWRGRVLRHSWFDLRAGSGRHAGTLILDYGSHPRNARAYPGRLFRDIVVHPDPDDADLLLGKAYLHLGRLAPVTFFLLERDVRAPEAA